MSQVQVYDGWEYCDFVMPFPRNSMYCRIDKDAYTHITAKYEFWDNCQFQVYQQLQLWKDQGWIPVSEVGPSALSCRTYITLVRTHILGWIIILILACLTLGLTLINAFYQYDEPTEVRIRMRRQVR